MELDDFIVAQQKLELASTSMFNVDDFHKINPAADKATLERRFVIPPFSVLNARAENWQERKRHWISLGIKGEEGRAEIDSANNICSEKWGRGYEYGAQQTGPNSPYRSFGYKKPEAAGRCFGQDIMKGENENFTDEEPKSNAGTSVFDPVLCECMYKWFGKKDGRILDPFAGGSTRGIVAGFLGYDYLGIDIRANQVAANQKQAENISKRLQEMLGAELRIPKWVIGDSTNLISVLEEEDTFGENFDFIWTCPPYFDLEVYSEMETDGSTFRDYEKFMVWYKDVFRQAISRLKQNRFVAVVIGDVRDHSPLHSYQGGKDSLTGRVHQGLEADTIRVFRELGLYYYNRFVLVTAVGSLPIRIGTQFPTYRKNGQTHQMVYVFWKGAEDHMMIPRELGELPKEHYQEAE